MQDFFERMEQQRREVAKKVESDKARLVGFLREKGVSSVEVSFSGYGDSGNVDDPVYSKQIDGQQEVPDTTFNATVWTDAGSRTVVRNKTVNELVADLCYAILESRHGGWEINEGSFGGFVIDVEEGSIALTYNQRVESYETSEEEY